MTRDAHDGGDSPKKTTKGPKSGLKKENAWNLNNFAPLVHVESGSAHRRVQDSEPDLNPDPGI